jgi:hypothetical protein
VSNLSARPFDAAYQGLFGTNAAKMVRLGFFPKKNEHKEQSQ